MVAQLDTRIAAQPPSTGRRFALLPVLGLVVTVLILLVGSGLFLSQQARANPEVVLPTETATLIQEECTDATVNAWWGGRDRSEVTAS
jgi:hypothetical protein